ncbi:hypothetical protein LTS18_004736 [Coniosporium uncinatum]|uniref:Uncharacterized protein n=1 Tax=Coniosporium uncinatum TaxID=93489 RepID=A0ACC3DRZ8_9PEZI|nr:hypothetical protein LTS18_004736 [Coniosporium uncinatum]
MVSTRSKPAQTHLDDFTQEAKPSKSKLAVATKQAMTKADTKANTPTKSKKTETEKLKSSPAKRKQPDTEDQKPTPSKRSKKSDPSNDDAPSEAPTTTIVINRAPVLHLWSASVAHFLHPSLSWETCLSAGSAISSICAVAKGRAIGTIEPADESDEKAVKKDEQRKKAAELEELQVMQFELKVKDGLVLVSGADKKGKPGGEEALKGKFGEEGYEKVKKGFEEALVGWRRKEEELSGKAFGMYEKFRPDVSKGQSGWGRKGELSLERVREVVGR